MIKVAVRSERWGYKTPFRIARHSAEALDVVVVELIDADGHIGRGEAAGVDYEGESVASMTAQIFGIADIIAAGVTREALLDRLPRGGARNAVDCALWDLEAKATGNPVWRRLGFHTRRSLATAYTLGIADDDDQLREKARATGNWPLLKLKMDGERHIDVARAVRAERPDARLIVDANQAWSRDLLDRLAPELETLGVDLIEQPLPHDEDEALVGYGGGVPLAADESCTDRRSVARLADLYRFVNIKLDKTGGLTEALAVEVEARARGLGVMVGCMAGTSLAMAPAAILAQQAEFVDLDGPLLHTYDRPEGIPYDGGLMGFPDCALWG
jgi:L-alanine-DL-glutamate epimerase-like enolase superfamily enzyme